MSTLALTVDDRTLAPTGARRLWLIIAVLTVAFYFIEHSNDQVSSLQAFTLTGDQMADKSADGDLGRRLAFPAMALFGAILLARREGWRINLQSHLSWLLLLYFSWCGASVLWSSEPSLTLRRFSVLMFCSLSALGIARQIALRDLCTIALAVSAILIANSVRVELSLGTFRPLATDYRFAGTLHPNVQAPYCAMMALAAACLASRAQRGRLLLWLLCLAGIGMLFLTKSRTVCAAFAAGLVVFNLFGAPWQKKLLAAAAIAGVGVAIVWGGALVGWDVERQATNIAMAGREAESEALSGRIPLWTAVIPSFAEHPFLGHGYQSFWTPERIESFSHAFEFLVPDGHSAYIDASLDLGLIGALFCLSGVVAGIREAGRGYLKTRDIGYGFVLALLACRSLNGLLESNFAAPTSFVPYVMVCGLMHLGFCQVTDDPSPLAGEAEI